MDKDIKAKWVAALRSGDYVQGKGRLCQKNEDGTKSWCCLGVLADVVDPSNWQDPDPYDNTGSLGYNGAYGSLFSAMRKLVGLNCVEISHLITMNDYQAESFKEIAAYIEENL